MAIDYLALKNEIANDPTALGYAGKEDNAIAVLLNQVRATIQIKRDNIMPSEVLEAIDSRDFVASPNAGLVAWFESVTQLRAIRLIREDDTETTVLGNMRRLLTNSNASQTRVVALGKRDGSRAEQLFGANTIITDADVARAKQTPG